MKTTARIAASLALAAASYAAVAQTTATPSVAASQPNAVGVTPETAKAANDKAIQRSDVATVVQTGPTAADRVRQAGHKVKTTTARTTNADGTTVAAADGTTLAPRPDRH